MSVNCTVHHGTFSGPEQCEHSPGEGGVCVEHGLAGHPLQQRQAPLPPLLDHPRLLAVEILGGEVLGEHAVQVQLLVHQGQLLVQLLELGEPAHDMHCSEQALIDHNSLPLPSCDGVSLLRTVEGEGGAGDFVQSVAEAVVAGLGHLEYSDPGFVVTHSSSLLTATDTASCSRGIVCSLKHVRTCHET